MQVGHLYRHVSGANGVYSAFQHGSIIGGAGHKVIGEVVVLRYGFRMGSIAVSLAMGGFQVWQFFSTIWVLRGFLSSANVVRFVVVRAVFPHIFWYGTWSFYRGDDFSWALFRHIMVVCNFFGSFHVQRGVGLYAIGL